MDVPGPQLPRAQTLAWLRSSTRFMERSHARYGDVFRLDLIGRAALGPGATGEEGTRVFLAAPDDIKRVFAADPSEVLAGVTNRFLEPLVGSRSILVLDEPEHMAERRLLLPPLHGDRVQAYRQVMRDVAERDVERWPRDEPFSLWPRMQAITAEVIARAVFGIPQGVRLDHVQGLLKTMLNRMTSARWLLGQAVRATVTRANRQAPPHTGSAGALIGPVEAALREEIRLRRAAADLESRDDILSMLLRARYDDGSAMTDEELRDELMTLLIAGHESTATSLAWAFERLLRHPDALERLRAEAETEEDPYADAVVKETLLRPVVPLVLRKLTVPMELGGFPLPTGTWLAPCAYLVHRREDVYPQADRFVPERFLERPAGTYTWMPFGGGVRRCLGASFAQLEMREVLRTVVARADLRVADAEPEAITSRFITLAPSRGARVVMRGVRPRSTAAPALVGQGQA